MRALWDVIGIGENSVDYVYRLPTYPEANGPNAKMRISSHSISCGGQIATTLCTGATGTDDNGRRIREELTLRGIDMSDAVIRDVANRFAVILVGDKGGERIVLWDRSADLSLRPRELPPEVLTAARVVHVDDTDQEAAIRAASIARGAGVHVTSDIDRVTPRTEELVAAVTVAILAEHVPEALTGEPDLERAMRKLRRLQPGKICVTLGARGSMLLDDDRIYHEPAFQLEAVDTTGAGDVFRGAFIYALLRGDAPADILRFANAAAGSSVMRLGAINGVPSLDDTLGLLNGAAVRTP
jgi:sulfofructose kinase